MADTMSTTYLLPAAMKVATASPPGSGLFHLVGSAHGNYVDAPFWAARWVMRGLAIVGIPASGAGEQVQVLKAIGATGAAFITSGADAGRQEFGGPAAAALLEPLLLRPRGD